MRRIIIYLIEIVLLQLPCRRAQTKSTAGYLFDYRSCATFTNIVVEGTLYSKNDQNLKTRESCQSICHSTESCILWSYEQLKESQYWPLSPTDKGQSMCYFLYNTTLLNEITIRHVIGAKAGFANCTQGMQSNNNCIFGRVKFLGQNFTKTNEANISSCKTRCEIEYCFAWSYDSTGSCNTFPSWTNQLYVSSMQSTSGLASCNNNGNIYMFTNDDGSVDAFETKLVLSQNVTLLFDVSENFSTSSSGKIVLKELTINQQIETDLTNNWKSSGYSILGENSKMQLIKSVSGNAIVPATNFTIIATLEGINATMKIDPRNLQLGRFYFIRLVCPSSYVSLGDIATTELTSFNVSDHVCVHEKFTDLINLQRLKYWFIEVTSKNASIWKLSSKVCGSRVFGYYAFNNNQSEPRSGTVLKRLIDSQDECVVSTSGTVMKYRRTITRQGGSALFNESLNVNWKNSTTVVTTNETKITRHNGVSSEGGVFKSSYEYEYVSSVSGTGSKEGHSQQAFGDDTAEEELVTLTTASNHEDVAGYGADSVGSYGTYGDYGYYGGSNATTRAYGTSKSIESAFFGWGCLNTIRNFAMLGTEIEIENSENIVEKCEELCQDNEGCLAWSVFVSSNAPSCQHVNTNSPMHELKLVHSPGSFIGFETCEEGRIGCFKDSPVRDLPHEIKQRNLYTDICVEDCRKSTYSYAGLQNGDQCWCGNLFGGFGQTSDSGCNVNPCNGKVTEYCGGTMRNYVYRTAFTESREVNEEEMCIFGQLFLNVDDLTAKNLTEIPLKSCAQFCQSNDCIVWSHNGTHCIHLSKKHLSTTHKHTFESFLLEHSSSFTGFSSCEKSISSFHKHTIEGKKSMFETTKLHGSERVFNIVNFDNITIHKIDRLGENWKMFGNYINIPNVTSNYVTLGRVIQGSGLKTPLSFSMVKMREKHFWRMTCPENYVSIGDVVTLNSQRPDINLYSCVHKNFVVEATTETVWETADNQTIIQRIVPLNCDAQNLNAFTVFNPPLTKPSKVYVFPKLPGVKYPDCKDKEIPLNPNLVGHAMRGWSCFNTRNVAIIGDIVATTDINGIAYIDICIEKCLYNEDCVAWSYILKNDVQKTASQCFHINTQHDLNYLQFVYVPNAFFAFKNCRTDYIGCFTDERSPRDLRKNVLTNGATSETCQKMCEQIQHSYFGLQYSKECWCGNSFGRYGLSDEGDCSSPCYANNTEMCGNKGKNSVYRTGIRGHDTMCVLFEGMLTYLPKEENIIEDASISNCVTSCTHNYDLPDPCIMWMHNTTHCFHVYKSEIVSGDMKFTYQKRSYTGLAKCDTSKDHKNYEKSEPREIEVKYISQSKAPVVNVQTHGRTLMIWDYDTNQSNYDGFHAFGQIAFSSQTQNNSKLVPVARSVTGSSVVNASEAHEIWVHDHTESSEKLLAFWDLECPEGYDSISDVALSDNKFPSKNHKCIAEEFLTSATLQTKIWFQKNNNVADLSVWQIQSNQSDSNQINFFKAFAQDDLPNVYNVKTLKYVPSGDDGISKYNAINKRQFHVTNEDLMNIDGRDENSWNDNPPQFFTANNLPMDWFYFGFIVNVMEDDLINHKLQIARNIHQMPLKRPSGHKKIGTFKVSDGVKLNTYTGYRVICKDKYVALGDVIQLGTTYIDDQNIACVHTDFVTKGVKGFIHWNSAQTSVVRITAYNCSEGEDMHLVVLHSRENVKRKYWVLKRPKGDYHTCGRGISPGLPDHAFHFEDENKETKNSVISPLNSIKLSDMMLKGTKFDVSGGRNLRKARELCQRSCDSFANCSTWSHDASLTLNITCYHVYNTTRVNELEIVYSQGGFTSNANRGVLSKTNCTFSRGKLLYTNHTSIKVLNGLTISSCEHECKEATNKDDYCLMWTANSNICALIFKSHYDVCSSIRVASERNYVFGFSQCNVTIDLFSDAKSTAFEVMATSLREHTTLEIGERRKFMTWRGSMRESQWKNLGELLSVNRHSHENNIVIARNSFGNGVTFPIRFERISVVSGFKNHVEEHNKVYTNVTFWRMICSSGFHSLGDVSSYNENYPSVKDYFCINKAFLEEGSIGEILLNISWPLYSNVTTLLQRIEPGENGVKQLFYRANTGSVGTNRVYTLAKNIDLNSINRNISKAELSTIKSEAEYSTTFAIATTTTSLPVATQIPNDSFAYGFYGDTYDYGLDNTSIESASSVSFPFASKVEKNTTFPSFQFITKSSSSLRNEIVEGTELESETVSKDMTDLNLYQMNYEIDMKKIKKRNLTMEDLDIWGCLTLRNVYVSGAPFCSYNEFGYGDLTTCKKNCMSNGDCISWSYVPKSTLSRPGDCNKRLHNCFYTFASHDVNKIVAQSANDAITEFTTCATHGTRYVGCFSNYPDFNKKAKHHFGKYGECIQHCKAKEMTSFAMWKPAHKANNCLCRVRFGETVLQKTSRCKKKCPKHDSSCDEISTYSVYQISSDSRFYGNDLCFFGMLRVEISYPKVERFNTATMFQCAQKCVTTPTCWAWQYNNVSCVLIPRGMPQSDNLKIYHDDNSFMGFGNCKVEDSSYSSVISNSFKIKKVYTEKIANLLSQDSKSHINVWEGHWNPQSNYFLIGQTLSRENETVDELSAIYSMMDNFWAIPKRYLKIWSISTNRSKEHNNGLTFWRIICPHNYISLGDVATKSEKPPSLLKYRCAHVSIVKNASIARVFNVGLFSTDEGNDNASVWRIRHNAKSFVEQFYIVNWNRTLRKVFTLNHIGMYESISRENQTSYGYKGQDIIFKLNETNDKHIRLEIPSFDKNLRVYEPILKDGWKILGHTITKNTNATVYLVKNIAGSGIASALELQLFSTIKLPDGHSFETYKIHCPGAHYALSDAIVSVGASKDTMKPGNYACLNKAFVEEAKDTNVMWESNQDKKAKLHQVTSEGSGGRKLKFVYLETEEKPDLPKRKFYALRRFSGGALSIGGGGVMKDELLDFNGNSDARIVNCNYDKHTGFLIAFLLVLLLLILLLLAVLYYYCRKKPKTSIFGDSTVSIAKAAVDIKPQVTVSADYVGSDGKRKSKLDANVLGAAKNISALHLHQNGRPGVILERSAIEAYQSEAHLEGVSARKMSSTLFHNHLHHRPSVESTHLLTTNNPALSKSESTVESGDSSMQHVASTKRKLSVVNHMIENHASRRSSSVEVTYSIPNVQRELYYRKINNKEQFKPIELTVSAEKSGSYVFQPIK